MQKVELAPLTAAEFAPFGEVVSLAAASGRAGVTANQGTATRYDWCAALTSTRPAAKANVVVFAPRARTLPIALGLVERHPCSTQMFVPMAVDRYVVVVAPTGADGEPRWSGLRAFLCGPGEAINYHVGAWHHPIIALGRDAELLMLAWEDGSAGDCEERSAPHAIELVG